MTMITDDDAKKLGKDLTSQHPLAVHCMVKYSMKIDRGFEINSVAVTAVRNDGCEICVTSCRGDLCSMDKSFYKFSPPLQSAGELNKRISDLHDDLCSPNPLWLITNPLALLILVFCGILSYGNYLSADGMADAFMQAPRLEKTINALFGTTIFFGHLVSGAFWISIVAHGVEAAIGVYYSLTLLKLGIIPTSLWGIMIFLVGYPIFKELTDLLSIVRNHSKSK
mmetsp:Transcript_29450/g.33076  ORF Transcript_29450/g.33076 Transcript_29450/m.33076 type:complete len:224 (+) Transcript_29450:71-742(+)